MRQTVKTYRIVLEVSADSRHEAESFAQEVALSAADSAQYGDWHSIVTAYLRSVDGPKT